MDNIIIKGWAIWFSEEDRFAVIDSFNAPYAIFPSKEQAQAHNEQRTRFEVIEIEIRIPKKKNKK